MADLSQKARNSVSLQREMFRLAEFEHGLSVAVLARTAGISLSTIKGWRDGAAMPAWALGELGIPDDLTSLVLQPYARFVVTDPNNGDEDFDGLGLEANGLAGEVQQSRHPQSPGGVNIVPMERAKIKHRARSLCAKARQAAA